jgi:WD40 repeat protein
MNKRQIDIINLLKYFIPNDVAKLISCYDYYLEGIAYTFAKDSSRFLCVDILPDGRIVSGSLNGNVNIWNLMNGNKDITFIDNKKYTCCVATLPDGRIISGSDSGELRIYNLKTGKCDITFSEHYNATCCVAFFSNTSMIPSYHLNVSDMEYRIVTNGSVSGTMKIWDPITGKCDMTLGNNVDSVCHSQLVRCVGILPNGKIISGSYDTTLKLWDPCTGKCEFTFYGHQNGVLCLRVLPGGHYFISGSMDKTLKLWNVKTGECEVTFVGHSDFVSCVALLPDGRIVSGSFDKTLKIWDISCAVINGKYDVTHMKSWYSHITLMGHSNAVCCVSVLADGRILSGSDDGTLKIWS